MWKVVARGIRETLERRACRTNVYSQPSQDNAKNEVKTNLTCQQKFLAPIFVTCDKGFCGSAKNAGAKSKENDHKWNAKHNWSEAFGWTSVLAAGWVVCQSLALHKRFFKKENERKNKVGYAGLSRILLQISGLQLKHILPITNCVGDKNQKKKLQNSDLQWDAEKSFGPITSEEALKKATDEFSNVHKIVIGEFELLHGVKALEEKRYKDAWTHFSQGAKLSSPGSMFNLGLCYELGIGILADQKKAVKYYNDAAVHDHADALYNLGVYHAQGRGGLPVDIDTARTYFIRAAKLGQVQAQHALDIEKARIRPKKTNDTATVPKIRLKDVALENMANNNTRNKIVGYDNDSNANYVANATCETAEYTGEAVKDPTQAFLELFDFKESSLIMITDDCRAPY